MTPVDPAKSEVQRRYATLVALAIEGMATITDEIIDLHDRIIGKLFNAVKSKRQQQFQASGKAIDDKVRTYGRISQVLIEAKQSGSDSFVTIGAVMPWDTFVANITEVQTLAQPADFDSLHHIGENYTTLRRYTPQFLGVLELRAASVAKDALNVIDMLCGMNSDNACRASVDAPTAFIKSYQAKLALIDSGIDRCYCELCTLSELKDALHSGDVWMQGSRQLKDSGEYLVPAEKFATLKLASGLPLAVATDYDQYLYDRLELLGTQLVAINHIAAANDLPDVIITTASGLKTTLLGVVALDAVQAMIDQTAMSLPHLKIIKLSMEVDEWTGLTRHSTYLKISNTTKDRTLLLTAILVGATNLGPTKVIESYPDTTYAKLS